MISLFFSTVKAQTDASTEIDNAQKQIMICYQAALNAENAGANITQLTSTLNEARALLTSAQQAYVDNNTDPARDLALQSQAKLTGFTEQAAVLEQNALNQSNMDFWVYTVGSIVGAFAVVGIAWGLWIYLKKKSSEKKGSVILHGY